MHLRICIKVTWLYVLIDQKTIFAIFQYFCVTFQQWAVTNQVLLTNMFCGDSINRILQGFQSRIHYNRYFMLFKAFGRSLILTIDLQHFILIAENGLLIDKSIDINMSMHHKIANKIDFNCVDHQSQQKWRQIQISLNIWIYPGGIKRFMFFWVKE